MASQNPEEGSEMFEWLKKFGNRRVKGDNEPQEFVVRDSDPITLRVLSLRRDAEPGITEMRFTRYGWGRTSSVEEFLFFKNVSEKTPGRAALVVGQVVTITFTKPSPGEIFGIYDVVVRDTWIPGD